MFRLVKTLQTQLGKGLLLIAVLAGAILVACSSATPVSQGDDTEAAAAEGIVQEEAYVLQQVPALSISVASETIGDDERLQQAYTCEGFDFSPQLSWSGVPAGTRSFAIVMEDRDPEDMFVDLRTHWVLYSIPPDVTELPEQLPAEIVLDIGAVHGTNDYDKTQYSGPCPRPTILNNVRDVNDNPVVSGLRPYHFTVYALDMEVALEPGVSRNALLEAIDGHILAAGEIAPKYRSIRKVTRPGQAGTTGRAPGR